MSGITSLEPPKRQSLDRAAADSLRRAILTGAIAPGARLTEARLAEQFMLSRGTVRAALQRLVSEGLVIQRPYSGWDVLTLTIQDAWELSTLRSSLEALAGRLVADKSAIRGVLLLWAPMGNWHRPSRMAEARIWCRPTWTCTRPSSDYPAIGDCVSNTH